MLDIIKLFGKPDETKKYLMEELNTKLNKILDEAKQNILENFYKK